MIQTPSVSPSSTEIGLNRQLRQIYDTPHLTPREVQRLFVPIVRCRELEQDVLLGTAHEAYALGLINVAELQAPLLVFAEQQGGHAVAAATADLVARAKPTGIAKLIEAAVSEDDSITLNKAIELATSDEIDELRAAGNAIERIRASAERFVEERTIADAADAALAAVVSASTFRDAVEAVDRTVSDRFGPFDQTFGDSIVELLARAGEDAGLDPRQTKAGHAFNDELGQLKPIAAGARRRLMEGVQQFVVKIARTYLGRGISLDDLIQEGNIGLMKAIDKFEPARGYALLTYANDWIHQAMGRACTNNGSLEKYQMRIPCHMYMAIGRVQKHWYSLCDELGRDPSPDELAQRCSISSSQAETALEVLSRSNFSLDAQSKLADSDSTVGDFIPDQDAIDPLLAALQSDQRSVVQRSFRQLTDEEQQVLLLRLDLANRGKPYTQEFICRTMGIKKSRMLNVERRALNKLQASLQKQAALGDSTDIV